MSSHRSSHRSSHHSGGSRGHGMSSSSGGSRSQNPPLVFDQDGYNVTATGLAIIPQAFRDIHIRKVFIEFLGVDTTGMSIVDPNNLKNHAIFKVDLVSRYGEYNGARIMMDPDWDSGSTGSNGGANTSYKPGRLLVKPVTYREGSRSSARTCRLEASNVPLDYLLLTMVYQQLDKFYFITIDEKYYGCRDFITQALYQLCLAEYLTPWVTDTSPRDPRLPVNNAFSALGMRFGLQPLGVPRACPIDRGYFLSYTPVLTADMPYHDTEKARELDQLLPR